MCQFFFFSISFHFISHRFICVFFHQQTEKGNGIPLSVLDKNVFGAWNNNKQLMDVLSTMNWIDGSEVATLIIFHSLLLLLQLWRSHSIGRIFHWFRFYLRPHNPNSTLTKWNMFLNFCWRYRCCHYNIPFFSQVHNSFTFALSRNILQNTKKIGDVQNGTNTFIHLFINSTASANTLTHRCYRSFIWYIDAIINHSKS